VLSVCRVKWLYNTDLHLTGNPVSQEDTPGYVYVDHINSNCTGNFSPHLRDIIFIYKTLQTVDVWSMAG
jgi:hypothetical protein